MMCISWRTNLMQFGHREPPATCRTSKRAFVPDCIAGFCAHTHWRIGKWNPCVILARSAPHPSGYGL
jgi:hypothetical protein